MAIKKKDPYTELSHYSALKCCQEAREVASRTLKEKKLTAEGVCAELELPTAKVKHWLDHKKKLVMSKAPRDRELMILLLHLGLRVKVSVERQ